MDIKTSIFFVKHIQLITEGGKDIYSKCTDCDKCPSFSNWNLIRSVFVSESFNLPLFFISRTSMSVAMKKADENFKEIL